MPVTLAQAALNAQDDLDANVIDEFRKQSAILDALVFHDTVSPMGGGSTLTYGYHRVTAQRGAAFRAINSEYTPAEAEKTRYSVDLKPLGGSFQIDRVLAGIARGAEVSFQIQQLVKATQARFTDELINGDTAVDSNGFDGLDNALAGSTTELNEDSVTDWSNLDAASYTAQTVIDVVDELLAVLDGPASMLIGNAQVLAKIRAAARRANMYTEAPVNGLFSAQGNPIMRQMFGNVLLVDAGEKAGSTTKIVPTESRDPDSTIYVVTVTGTPGGGTFSLNVTADGTTAETAAIAYNASAAAVQAAIIALANVPADGVVVTGSAGGPFTLTFGGELTDEVVVVALADNDLTGGSSPSVTTVESATTTNYTNLTDLYAVRIGLDGFHGVSAVGDLLKVWLPDFERAGAVKTGEVEMGPAAAVLKSTKAAAVYRNIKVA